MSASRRLIAADIFSLVVFFLFQIPVYMMALFAAGVPFEAILVAAAGQVVGMTVTARPYGLWLQFCRARFVPGMAVV